MKFCAILMKIGRYLVRYSNATQLGLTPNLCFLFWENVNLSYIHVQIYFNNKKKSLRNVFFDVLINKINCLEHFWNQ